MTVWCGFLYPLHPLTQWPCRYLWKVLLICLFSHYFKKKIPYFLQCKHVEWRWKQGAELLAGCHLVCHLLRHKLMLSMPYCREEKYCSVSLLRGLPLSTFLPPSINLHKIITKHTQSSLNYFWISISLKFWKSQEFLQACFVYIRHLQLKPKK